MDKQEAKEDLVRGLLIRTACRTLETQEGGYITAYEDQNDGPWVLVELTNYEDFRKIDRFAIWKQTAAVYRIGPDNSVEEDPIIEIEKGVQ